MEVIAVYWEPKIKTYGFQVKSGLRLVTLALPLDRVAQWARCLGRGKDPRPGFILVLAQAVEAGALRIHLLLEPRRAEKAGGPIRELVSGQAGALLETDTPAELVYFQGPHFGDRYGIADAVFRCLAGRDWQILAAAFSGASVYLAVPENRAQAAVECLCESFVTPGPHVRPAVKP